MKTLNILTALSISSFAFIQSGFTGEPSTAFLKRVQVTVSCTDNEIKNKIQSFITRELRSLKDVIDTNESPDFRIVIVSELVMANENNKTGVALSTLVTEVFNPSAIDSLRSIDKEKIKILKKLVANTERIRKYFIQVGSISDLQDICVQIVADFDTEQLAPLRKEHERMSNK